MRSLGKVLDSYKGIGPGFDLLRLGLSIAILTFHGIIVSYGSDKWIWAKPISAPFFAMLPMFFALSGFLVFGSAQRTGKLGNFIILRVLRITPALATEISISAIVLGALVTTHPLASYFTDPKFFEYFGSLIGRVRVKLPGVFITNPYDVVNVSLWTITSELLCYVYIALLMVTGIFRRKILHTVLVVLLLAYFIGYDLIVGIETWPGPPQASFLVASFAIGNLFYVWRNEIPYSWPLFIACVVVAMFTAYIVGLNYLTFTCCAYAIVFLGLTPLPKVPVLSKGDYSYGIYLYAFPIQQMVAYMFPELREWYWNVLISLPIVIGVAMLSWNFVEKPTLALRKLFHKSGAAPAALKPNYAGRWVIITLLFAYGLYLTYEGWLFNVHNITLLQAALAVGGFSAATGCVILTIAARARSKSRAQDSRGQSVAPEGLVPATADAGAGKRCA